MAKRGDNDGELGSVGAEKDFCTGILLLSHEQISGKAEGVDNLASDRMCCARLIVADSKLKLIESSDNVVGGQVMGIGELKLALGLQNIGVKFTLGKPFRIKRGM